MGILPSIPALNQPGPRYLAHSIVFSNFSPRTEMAERVPMEPRKSVFLTAVVSGASAASGSVVTTAMGNHATNKSALDEQRGMGLNLYARFIALSAFCSLP